MAELNRVTPLSEEDEGPRKRKSHYPYDDPDYGEPYKFDPDFKGPTRWEQTITM